ncbi:hypothetical protein GCM10009596_01630 [Arthrobacter rhombi]|uniref:hypothetical protein n=1 Tax=Arthrobacter rhombi TaxID=71253 RepID=UPI0031D23E44
MIDGPPAGRRAVAAHFGHDWGEVLLFDAGPSFEGFFDYAAEDRFLAGMSSR